MITKRARVTIRNVRTKNKFNFDNFSNIYFMNYFHNF
jgi:hypothetical protein